MTPEEIPLSLREALGYWQSLRKLGYSANDIFVMAGSLSREVSVELRRKGKVVSFFVGLLDVDHKVFAEAYVKAAQDMPNWDQKTLEEMYQKSRASRENVAIATRLVLVGMWPR